MQAAVASQLLPGLGYFGDRCDALALPLPGPVEGIRLVVEDPLENQILNLQGLTLLRDGETVDTTHATATQSSTYPGTRQLGPAQLLQGRGIHTDMQTCAWWEARFDPAVTADQLLIGNRRDQWGRRARRLHVLVRQPGGTWQRIHEGCGADQALSCLLALQGLVDPWPATGADDPAALRRMLLASLARRILERSLDLDRLPWMQILPLVDIWTVAPLTRDEEIIVAARLTRALGIETVACFDAKLSTRSAILRLNDRLDEIGSIHGTGRYVVSRHGVQKSLLRTRTDDFMRHLQEVLAHLEALGREPMIAYGSLLGAVRDRAFIAHDDDVDVLYRSTAQTPEAMQADLAAVGTAMRERGYAVEGFDGYYNLHVHSADDDVSIDIFPCWQRSDECHLHMEKMRIRGIPQQILFPRSTLSLYGHAVPAPGRAEDFLQSRYGSGWTQSDPFFEWPWTLNAEA